MNSCAVFFSKHEPGRAAWMPKSTETPGRSPRSSCRSRRRRRKLHLGRRRRRRPGQSTSWRKQKDLNLALDHESFFSLTFFRQFVDNPAENRTKSGITTIIYSTQQQWWQRLGTSQYHHILYDLGMVSQHFKKRCWTKYKIYLLSTLITVHPYFLEYLVTSKDLLHNLFGYFQCCDTEEISLT